MSLEIPGRSVRSVCLLGGESSGKTTLARRLAETLGTVWVPEYGRALWEEKDGQLTFEDLLHIGLTQIAHEDEAAAHAKRWLICDTSPLTTLFYCLDSFGHADPRLENLAERRYEKVFLCAPDFGFVQDGNRRDHDFRQLQHDWYERELKARGMPYVEIEGSIEARLHTALRQLAVD